MACRIIVEGGGRAAKWILCGEFLRSAAWQDRHLLGSDNDNLAGTGPLNGHAEARGSVAAAAPRHGTPHQEEDRR